MWGLVVTEYILIWGTVVPHTNGICVLGTETSQSCPTLCFCSQHTIILWSRNNNSKLGHFTLIVPQHTNEVCMWNRWTVVPQPYCMLGTNELLFHKGILHNEVVYRDKKQSVSAPLCFILIYNEVVEQKHFASGILTVPDTNLVCV